MGHQDCTVRLAFADDHPVLLAGVASIFSSKPGFTVVGTACSAEGALALAAKKFPDLLFMDLSMPGGVFAAITEIARTYPATKVIVFTAYASVDSALRALDAGATGFVLKGCMAEELVEASEAVMRGEVYITKEYASQVLRGLRNRNERNDGASDMTLNVREKQIVSQLMRARTNREIAETLQISEKTVKNYMTGLMAKLNARNRVEVVVAAQRNARQEDLVS
jgi:DNA-binding NarL/FixJ family response regulator